MKFRSIGAAVLVWLGLAGVACAATSVTMDGPMTDSNAALGVAGTPRAYTLNMDDHNIDYISAQVVYSSGTYGAVTFNDGSAASGTLTVVSATILSSATASGTVIVISSTGLVGQTVFVGGY